MISPKEIKTASEYDYMGSAFRNMECEVIARNIVLIAKQINPDAWTDFTWEEYTERCTHKVTREERAILEAMTDGGKPIWNSSCYLQPGYLERHHGRYRVAQKFLDALPGRVFAATKKED